MKRTYTQEQIAKCRLEYYRCFKDFEKSLSEYIDFYNEGRPHNTLKYKTPHQAELDYWSSNSSS